MGTFCNAICKAVYRRFCQAVLLYVCTFYKSQCNAASTRRAQSPRLFDTMSIVTAHSDFLANYPIARKNPTPPCTPNGPSGRSDDVTNRVLVWNGVLGPVLDQVARGGSRSPRCGVTGSHCGVMVTTLFRSAWRYLAPRGHPRAANPMQDCLSSHSLVQIDVFFLGPEQMLNLSILSKKVNHEWSIFPCGQYKYIMPGVKTILLF